MNKLTDEQIERLPEWVQSLKKDLDSQLFLGRRETLELRLIGELARNLTLMPCGHPRGCVVSLPYIGENKSNSCGWCAVSDDLAGSIEFNREVVAENLALEAERDALREKMEAAHALSNALNTMIYLREGGDRLSEVTSKQWEDALRQSKIAIGTWGSAGQSDALREKLAAAEGLAEATEAFLSPVRSMVSRIKVEHALAAWKEATSAEE